MARSPRRASLAQLSAPVLGGGGCGKGNGSPNVGVMCSDGSEGESKLLHTTRKEGKQAAPMGAGGGGEHAGVLLGFMHPPSPRAPQSPFRGCFLLKPPQSRSRSSEGGSQAEWWLSKSCLPASLFASALCERGLGRGSASPRSPRWPCCQPATAWSRGPQLPMCHVRLAWKGSPWACPDLWAAEGDAQARGCGHVYLLTGQHPDWKPSCRTKAHTHAGPRGPDGAPHSPASSSAPPPQWPPYFLLRAVPCTRSADFLPWGLAALEGQGRRTGR